MESGDTMNTNDFALNVPEFNLEKEALKKEKAEEVGKFLYEVLRKNDVLEIKDLLVLAKSKSIQAGFLFNVISGYLPAVSTLIGIGSDEYMNAVLAVFELTQEERAEFDNLRNEFNSISQESEI